MSQGQESCLFWIAPRSNHLPGETIIADLKLINGNPMGKIILRIEGSPGSGFAGQVYKAAVQKGSGLPHIVAVKVLRPHSKAKLWFRDLLFQICFQTSYSPRLREDAVQAGLLWQSILRAAAKIELGSASFVAQPIGYFWDPELASFAEIHEWVDGRPSRNEPDEYVLARLFHWPHPTDTREMTQKKEFMDRLVRLCHDIGADGLARQYEWWTLVSQDNVLTRITPIESSILPSGSSANKTQFCAVDCRPGLAIPFFGLFSPAHARIIWNGVRKGVLVHFAESNINQLRAYCSRHFSAQEHQESVDHLALVETRNRRSFPDLWQSPGRIFREKNFIHDVRLAAAHDLLLCGQIAPEFLEEKPGSAFLLQLILIISLLPWVGQFITRLIAHPGYRRHLASLLSNAHYRQTAWRTWQLNDLAAWQVEGRIDDLYCQFLKDEFFLYLIHKILASLLPPQGHRLLTDKQCFISWIRTIFIHPLQILAHPNQRITWLDTILAEQYQRGLISADLYHIHMDQIREPRMQGYIRDLALNASLDMFSRLVYLLFGLYGISTGNFLPLGVAFLAPIPPSGPIRVIYLLAQIALDPGRARRWNQDMARVLQARFAALLISPWRWFGNFFPIVEISAFYTRLSFLFAEYFISQAAEKAPIFGGRGKFLEYAVFQVFYNLPLSLRHEIKKRFSAQRSL